MILHSSDDLVRDLVRLNGSEDALVERAEELFGDPRRWKSNRAVWAVYSYLLYMAESGRYEPDREALWRSAVLLVLRARPSEAASFSLFYSDTGDIASPCDLLCPLRQAERVAARVASDKKRDITIRYRGGGAFTTVAVVRYDPGA